jgi:hypothetical protein
MILRVTAWLSGVWGGEEGGDPCSRRFSARGNYSECYSCDGHVALDLCQIPHSIVNLDVNYDCWLLVYSVLICCHECTSLTRGLNNKGNCGVRERAFGMSVLFPFFWWDWGLNSGLCTCKAGAVPLEPHLHSILLWLFWRWGLENYLSPWASNHNLPDLSLPKS